ncbi:flagellar biosynthetic protein FliO [Viridibacillus sp. YIM B01967]|uniref:Flagellar biosynthetic protein FliO n=1 Tax=Viridibacillus soli TaxID=2798301 RepID=A0ABS1H4M9_9BACL|nr:flagellar biosynthetic protein FliO [Viridibacillus soli]MBK3494378.1 flagellar biosynthetic protein FliO [Viridibacillus soli]
MFYKGLLKLMLCASIFTIAFIIPMQNPTPTFAESGGMVDECYDKDKDACKEDSPTAVNHNNPSTAVGLSPWEYIKMVLALIFVVALLYGMLKFVNSRNQKYQHNQMMQNLGGLSLGQQKSVQLLKVGDSLYLVGVGEDVHILKEISGEAEKERLMTLYNDKQEFSNQVPYMAEIFTSLKEKVRRRSKTEDKSKDEFKDLFQQKISKIKTERSKDLNEWKQKESDKE